VALTQIIRTAFHENYEIRELESGSIVVFEGGEKQSVVKPVLRKIAGMLAVSIVNSKGNPHNTRKLGTLIIQELNQQRNELKVRDFLS